MRVALMLACTATCANEPQDRSGAAPDGDLPTIAVTAQRDPVDKSYRKMVQGMDLFEAKHGMAPKASLRFKLLPRQPDTNMDGIVLAIVGDSETIPVPLASDRTFTLERRQKALDEDASVRPNRSAGRMTWRAEIRTPDLPPDTRRLGDLRLECHVGMKADLISNRSSVIGQVANFLLGMRDYCEGSEVHYLFFSEHPLFSVTMVAGSRREILPVDELYAGASYGLTSKADLPYCDCQVLLDRSYFLPLGDRSWPDDTLIEFEYMDDADDRRAAAARSVAVTNGKPPIIGKSTKTDLVAALGKTTVIGFDSGFEVWVYRATGDTPAKPGWEALYGQAGSEKGTPGKTEFVVLFAPSGVVARTRIRPAPPPAKGT